MKRAGSWTEIVRKTNNVLLAPVIGLANAGLATAHVAVGGAARAAETTASVARASGFPRGEAVEDLTRRFTDPLIEGSRQGVERAAGNVREAFSGDLETSANRLLARTLVDDVARAAALPASAVASATIGHAWFQSLLEALSRGLDPLSWEGVLPDPITQKLAARLRAGMVECALGGPFGAITRDFSGMAGGLGALLLGDTTRLAEGAESFRDSMRYVYEKKLQGEVQPESDFPIKEQLAAHASAVIEKYPEKWVEALKDEDYVRIADAYLRNPVAANTLLLRYPRATYQVMTGVMVFVGLQGFFQVEDAFSYALAELAIMDSRLPDGDKDWAHDQLRMTASKSIVGYEYYIPLLVPFDGGVEDKAYRRDAAGEIIDDRGSAPSVFPKRSIELAQAMIGELIGLRALLWLYGDEEAAREKNYEETARKFGPGPARRIEDDPRFPLTREEVDELSSGRRTREEVDEILDDVLRDRGLLTIADAVRRGAFVPGELL